MVQILHPVGYRPSADDLLHALAMMDDGTPFGAACAQEVETAPNRMGRHLVRIHVGEGSWLYRPADAAALAGAMGLAISADHPRDVDGPVRSDPDDDRERLASAIALCACMSMAQQVEDSRKAETIDAEPEAQTRRMRS